MSARQLSVANLNVSTSATMQRELPLPPPELERRLKTAPLVITAVEGAGGGVMGAKKLTLFLADDQRPLEAKWKEAPAGGDGWNNSPRREIGVYEVQKLFLDPDDYIIPPVAARGIDFGVYQAVKADPSANVDGTQCVYGALAVWLSNTTQPHRVFDRELFSRNQRYAYHFGNLNLLHYLVEHRDARTNNFLMSTDPDNPKIFSIDNGIAFGATLFNFFTWHFNKIRVDRLPRRSIDRLRQLRRVDLDRLGVLSELRADPEGVLRDVAPGPNLDCNEGNRVRPGVVQIGLTSTEIDAIAVRIQKLLGRIDRGKLSVF
jgi:hypothetical protein